MNLGTFALVLTATLTNLSQGSDVQAFMTRVYVGYDFGDYSLDPPYWSYQDVGFRHSKSAHWLYKNHHHVFIDIKLKPVESQ